jgi:hypothetical protein
MKVTRFITMMATAYVGLMRTAWAQYGGFGNDEVTSTLERTIGWLQITAISILAIYVIFNLIRMGKDDEEGPRAKKHVLTGIVAIAGVMLLRGLINLVQQLTASSISVGF